MTETIAVLGVGPSFGLGAALARRFARGGFQVFIARRNLERLTEVAQETAKLGKTYRHLRHQGKSAWTFETEVRPKKESV